MKAAPSQLIQQMTRAFNYKLNKTQQESKGRDCFMCYDSRGKLVNDTLHGTVL